MIITIDGPVATGKSTIAKKLAEQLGFVFFDTGAMYRVLTYGVLKHRINIKDPLELSRFLEPFSMNIEIHQGEKRYFFENEDVTATIRQKEVTTAVSEVSAIKSVRDKLVFLQRQLSQGVDAIFEGRDMGSVVFPQADLKIFLTGKDEIRAKRRFEEFKAKHLDEAKQLTIQQCLDDITRRDRLDSTREISPLRQASDACVIDTSHLSEDEVVSKIIEYKNLKIPKGGTSAENDPAYPVIF